MSGGQRSLASSTLQQGVSGQKIMSLVSNSSENLRQHDSAKVAVAQPEATAALSEVRGRFKERARSTHGVRLIDFIGRYGMATAAASSIRQNSSHKSHHSIHHRAKSFSRNTISHANADLPTRFDPGAASAGTYVPKYTMSRLETKKRLIQQDLANPRKYSQAEQAQIRLLLEQQESGF